VVNWKSIKVPNELYLQLVSLKRYDNEPLHSVIQRLISDHACTPIDEIGLEVQKMLSDINIALNNILKRLYELEKSMRASDKEKGKASIDRFAKR